VPGQRIEDHTPGAYDYSPERSSWMPHHLTDWCGDNGFVHQVSCKIRRHNPVGDVLFIRGKSLKFFPRTTVIT
jgi:hypothetical protein